MREAITGEQLNVLFGSIPLKDKEKDAVKENILKLIKEKYNFEEEDFQIAELEVVPACKSRDLGLDRSMVIAYGQDDREFVHTQQCVQYSMLKILKKPLSVYSWTKKK